jgi:nucleoside-diphosphate-sugar epimerase
MAADEPTPAREILLLGPYGVLGTGVVDAVVANSASRVVTAARRTAPAYRDPDGLRHINVDLLDREGTRAILTKLDTVTDLVFAAYVEKPTMAETVEPSASMFRNALDAFSASKTPLQRVVLAGGAEVVRVPPGLVQRTHRRRRASPGSSRRSITTSRRTS